MPLEDWNKYQREAFQSLEIVSQVRIQDASVYQEKATEIFK